MQVFKELGLYHTMIEESLKYYDLSACIITIESLAGKLLHKWMEDVNEVSIYSSTSTIGFLR